MFNIMTETSTTERRCKDCSVILIFGENAAQSSDTSKIIYCRSCKNARNRKSWKNISDSAATDTKAKWRRIRRLITSCISRYNSKHKDSYNDDVNTLIKHLKEKYPELPVKCPFYKENDLIYSALPHDSPFRSMSVSIDRIDSSKGYVVGNVEILSFKGNTIKNNSTPDDVIKLTAFMNETQREKTAKALQDNGFVFFSKNNTTKLQNHEKIFENTGGCSSYGSNIIQCEFKFGT
jgi:hypothetical protein